MTTLDPALLDAALRLVRELTTDRAGMGEARQRLAPLRERWPGADPAIVRDEEAADGSVSFDVLLREPAGTVSVAYSPTPALPWPLRGAVRHSDRHLARVGTRTLRVGEALTALDFLWYDHDVLARLVDTGLVATELEQHPVEVDDDELQAAADAYRRAKGLLDAEATARWLTERGLSAEDFADLIAHTVAVTRLRGRVVGDRLPGWFAAHRSSFDTLVIAWTAEGSPPTDRAAALSAVAAAVHAGRAAGILRTVAVAAPPGLRDADGPAPTTIAGTAVTAVVVDREPAVLDGGTRALVERAMFDEWLAQRRAETDVEWFWLPRDRTTRVR
ncbi:TIGR04500 family putative peptide maturation system protein [Micromonospora sp. WMMD714]|uniref:TIGR04500 family putative peptide maturation system protein n=1 Tax=Micromonospora sp. WMMD714 TaxID=3016097 RepID=UPI00249ACB02|nr:TIGR04500 family putative peptide maturation system protein [Micromonospora sp. WMMD714]WFE62854.1 TIGR04500 family putative peptide maturation system protein [Micromonospora sp. WMMD714]